jgi:hypothetical protein
MGHRVTDSDQSSHRLSSRRNSVAGVYAAESAKVRSAGDDFAVFTVRNPYSLRAIRAAIADRLPA